MGLGDHGSVTSTSSERWHLTPREQIKSPTRAQTRDFTAYLSVALLFADSRTTHTALLNLKSSCGVIWRFVLWTAT